MVADRTAKAKTRVCVGSISHFRFFFLRTVMLIDMTK